MTRNSGVTGKTIPQLHRATDAARRKAERDERTPVVQLEILALRPGRSARERKRLEAAL